ncbi:MAG: hypothetical protein HYY18_22085 [Planctomycetes bacterium]|nr:hypothetical protein [Planctomycetota bacterium]
MDKVMLWGRAFPIVTIVVCIVLLVLVKKIFAKEGAGSSLNWAYIILFAMICGSVGLAVWGFKHVKPPPMEGTWK